MPPFALFCQLMYCCWAAVYLWHLSVHCIMHLASYPRSYKLVIDYSASVAQDSYRTTAHISTCAYKRKVAVFVVIPVPILFVYKHSANSRVHYVRVQLESTTHDLRYTIRVLRRDDSRETDAHLHSALCKYLSWYFFPLSFSPFLFLLFSLFHPLFSIFSLSFTLFRRFCVFSGLFHFIVRCATGIFTQFE